MGFVSPHGIESIEYLVGCMMLLFLEFGLVLDVLIDFFGLSYSLFELIKLMATPPFEGF